MRPACSSWIDQPHDVRLRGCGQNAGGKSARLAECREIKQEAHVHRRSCKGSGQQAALCTRQRVTRLDENELYRECDAVPRHHCGDGLRVGWSACSKDACDVTKVGQPNVSRREDHDGSGWDVALVTKVVHTTAPQEAGRRCDRWCVWSNAQEQRHVMQITFVPVTPRYHRAMQELRIVSAAGLEYREEGRFVCDWMEGSLMNRWLIKIRLAQALDAYGVGSHKIETRPTERSRAMVAS